MTQMTHATKLTLLILWLSAAVLLFALWSDLRLQHYEDGSGRITYCIPLAPCDDR